MQYYILDNKSMPWGDYGDILFAGMLDNTGEQLLLERTGPYIPELYLANISSILVTDTLKVRLESAGIKGITGFRPVLKQKIVRIGWQDWDPGQQAEFYPDSGEPEDYILEEEHDPELAAAMPEVWEMQVATQYQLEKNDGSFHLKETPALDIFMPENMGWVVVSAVFRELLMTENIDTVTYRILN